MNAYNTNRLTVVEKTTLWPTNEEEEGLEGEVPEIEAKITTYEISAKTILNKLSSLPQRL